MTTSNCTCEYTNYTTLQPQLHHIALHYITLHSLHHHKCNCNYTTLITLHHNYSYNCNYNYNCTTPHYIQESWWGDHCNHGDHSEKHNSDSNHLSVHQWIRSAIRDSQQPTSPISFLFLKLPPPPCAALLVSIWYWYDDKPWYYDDIWWQTLMKPWRGYISTFQTNLTDEHLLGESIGNMFFGKAIILKQLQVFNGQSAPAGIDDLILTFCMKGNKIWNMGNQCYSSNRATCFLLEYYWVWVYDYPFSEIGRCSHARVFTSTGRRLSLPGVQSSSIGEFPRERSFGVTELHATELHIQDSRNRLKYI